MTSNAGPGGPSSWRPNPVVYELNTLIWLGEVANRVGAPVTLETVPANEWDDVVPQGVTVVWLMGIWTRSRAGRDIALADPALRSAWTEALPDWTESDVAGSAYCILDYEPAPAIGGWDGLDCARAELRARGALLMVDWVPNHVGPDSPWLQTDPAAFVRGTADELAVDPGAFVEIAGGVFAKGKDPYFAPWPDVVQVDAFSPALRRLAAEALCRIAEHADAVRCDMAMLMLDDVVAATWGDRVGAPPARTYWTEVMGAVHAQHPAFRFIAESYWQREWDLQQLGFDYCYDKELYDRLQGEDVPRVRRHLGADLVYQERLVRFLENHDEPRAASTFGPLHRQMAATVVVATLPGLTLWHDGQAEGRAVFTPVFLSRRAVEPADSELKQWQLRMWKLACDVRVGDWSQREVRGWPDNDSAQALVASTWTTGDSFTLVVVNLSANHADGVVNIGDSVDRGSRWRLTDLLEGDSYLRDGAELADHGLYVARPGWGAHILRATPVAAVSSVVNESESIDVDG